MDLLLKEHISRVLQLQSDAGYKDSTISFYRIVYNRLETLAEQIGIDKFNEELARTFLEDNISQRTGTTCKSRIYLQNIAVRRLREYANTGQINWNNNMHNSPVRKRLNTQTFQLVLNSYLLFLSNEQKKKNTVDGYRNIASSFLLFCEKQSISELASLKPFTVERFFRELSQTWSPLSIRTAAPALRSFLTFANAPDEAIQLIPVNCPRKTVIPQVLTEDQEDRLWATLCAKETSSRDRALVMLLFVSGLRPVDAVHMLLDDIDWNKSLIHLVQQKTNRPLTLPLAPAVGNAIIKCLFWKSEIERSDPAGGARLFRSGMASNLLKAGVPLNQIADCLGHANHESAYAYLSVDRHRMQQCVLPLPQTTEGGEDHA